MAAPIRTDPGAAFVDWLNSGHALHLPAGATVRRDACAIVVEEAARGLAYRIGRAALAVKAAAFLRSQRIEPTADAVAGLLEGATTERDMGARA